jgi:hypothetical protein
MNYMLDTPAACELRERLIAGTAVAVERGQAEPVAQLKAGVAREMVREPWSRTTARIKRGVASELLGRGGCR